MSIADYKSQYDYAKEKIFELIDEIALENITEEHRTTKQKELERWRDIKTSTKLKLESEIFLTN